MIRHYIVPRVGDGKTPFSCFRAKYYASDDEPNLFPKGSRTYSIPGRDAVMVEADTSEAEHTALVSQADVVWADQDISAIASQQRALVARCCRGSVTGLIQSAVKSHADTEQREHGAMRAAIVRH